MKVTSDKLGTSQTDLYGQARHSSHLTRDFPPPLAHGPLSALNEICGGGSGMGHDRYRPIIAQQSESALVHQPFRNLDKVIPKVGVRPAAKAPAAAAAPAAPQDSAALFEDAMADVRPLPPDQRERVAGTAPATPAR